jgi:MFS family permease
MSVLLEYPTGVIGDYYSHKISVFWGYLILALSYILLSFSGGIIFYSAALFLLALGGSLVSGSDNALLHSVSEDFKRDYSQIKSYSIVVTFIAVSVGGFVSAIDLRIPLYLTASFLIMAASMVISTKIKVRGKDDNANIFELGLEGLKYSFNNKQLLDVMIISALIGAFFFSFKWLYNPLFQSLELNVASWGILAGVATLLIAAGVKFYEKFSKLHIFLTTLILLLAVISIGAINIPLLALDGMFIAHFMRGYFETKLMVDMNSVITKSVRSSVLSLNSLLIRAGATAFMFTGGIILEKYSMMLLMFLSVIIFLVIGAFPLLKLRKLDAVAKKV